MRNRENSPYLGKTSIILTFFAFIFLLFPPSVFASDNISALVISKNFESSTKYFYDARPWVSGNISSQVKSVLVHFDNISNDVDYFVAISDPVTFFSTAGKCFSPSQGNCSDDIPDGTYKVTAEAFSDIDVSQVYVFPKLLVKIPNGSAVDQAAPEKPILDAISSPIDADNVTLNGSAEANSQISVQGEGQSKTQQLTNGETRFSITVSLTQNAQNNFQITATDEAGNISEAVNVAITEETPPTPTPAEESPTPTQTPTVTFKKSVSYRGSSGAFQTSGDIALENPVATVLKTTTPGDDSSVKGASTENESKSSKALRVGLYILAALAIIAAGYYLISKFAKRKKPAKSRKSKRVDKKRRVGKNKLR
ncbi:MAG: Ig-like domain-containing protein [Candidatus Berkelbacteria bacterium]|nr:Ig-like domain-containing protein [Candidatus Berkelbacteria bacterium]